MATTGFRFPTTDAAVSGSWTNATNVQADDGSVAVCNIAAKNTTSVREQGGFGFSTGVLPDAATITQVNLRVEWRIQTSSSVIANLGCRARVTTTDLTLHENTSEPTTLTIQTFDITAERAWSPADFRDGTLKTRLQGRNGNDASDPGYEFDYVAIEVVYTTSQTFQQTVPATAVGVAGLTRTITFKRTLAATGTGVAGLSTKLIFKQAVAAASVGVAALSTKLVYLTTLAATATGVAGMTLGLTFKRTLAATASGVVNLIRKLTFKRTLTATAVGVATVASNREGSDSGSTYAMTIMKSYRSGRGRR